MPKIPLYNQQSQIGTAQGVTIDPSYAVGLAEAKSKTNELNVYQDVLKLGESFVKTYKENKYETDMAESKSLEQAYVNQVDEAFEKHRLDGGNPSDFKNDKLQTINKKYEETLREKGFFGESLRDATESFNLLKEEEFGNIDKKIAKYNLQDKVNKTADLLYKAQKEGNKEQEKKYYDMLVLLEGESAARQRLEQGEGLSYVDKQRRTENRLKFTTAYNEMIMDRTKKVGEQTSVVDKMQMMQGSNDNILSFINETLQNNPNDKEYYAEYLAKFDNEWKKEFTSADGSITATAKRTEINGILSENITLALEQDDDLRDKNYEQVKKNNQLLLDKGHFSSTTEMDNANKAYFQAGQYSKAQSDLMGLGYDDFKTKWSELEEANEKGKFTVEQWASLNVLNRANDNREHKRVFLDPLKDIINNPQNYSEKDINSLKGITDEQRATMMKAYKQTLVPNLYGHSEKSSELYANINKQITKVERAIVSGYYTTQYQNAKTDEEKAKIEQEAKEQGVVIGATGEVEAYDSITSVIDDILDEIYKQEDDKFLLPKNLIVDLTTRVYSFAGDEKAYVSESNPYSTYERKLYTRFEEFVLPALLDLENKSAINAITMMRKLITDQVDVYKGKQPRKPVTYVPSTFGGNYISGNDFYLDPEQLKAYEEATEEWKQSDQGIEEFLIMCLYPMFSKESMNYLLSEIRGTNIDLTESADEVYNESE